MRPGMRIMLFLLLLAPAAGLAQPHRERRAAEIRENPGAFLDKTVEVVGFVTQYVDSGSGDATFYYAKDDWGGLIRIQTKGDPPAVGRRYAIAGRVTMDTAANDPYLVEEERREISVPQPAVQAGAPRVAAGTAAASVAGGAQPAAPLPFQGLAWVAALVALTAGVVAFVRYGRQSRTPAVVPAGPAVPAAWPAPSQSFAEPAPQQVLEGKTIRIYAPPKNTVKILPGWLEVMSQDDAVRQILFYRLKGDAVPEITFGRSSGRPYSHVQLKPQTVSARQARLSFEGAQVRLTNLASEESNPTRLNGAEMRLEESHVLADGDLIAMGEVLFRYHKV